MFYCCIFNFFNNCYESGEIIASKKIVCGTLINHVGTQTERYIKITLLIKVIDAHKEMSDSAFAIILQHQSAFVIF